MFDRKNIKLFLVFFMIFLLINISISVNYVLAQNNGEDYGQGVITGFATQSQNQTDPPLPDPGQQCIDKEKSVSTLVQIMDNGIISTLEKVASIMFMITTVMSAIDTLINTVYNAIGCCAPNPINAIPCGYKELQGKVWALSYAPVKTLACFTSCGWCTGGGDCMGVMGFANGVPNLGQIPGVIKQPESPDNPEGTVPGIGQFHLSPYENIYTAIGCACPIAILFNLRKLKTIYQVNSCCIEQACKKGLSTEACATQLSEATCMYWRGSLLKMFVKALFSVITSFIYKKVLALLVQVHLADALYCPLSLWDLAHVPDTLKGIKASWEWMSATFKEPTCENLGFEKIDEQMRSGIWTSSEGINTLTLNDKNKDGRYDGVTPNYNKKTVKLDDLPQELKDNPAFQKGAITQYQTRAETGELATYYEVDTGLKDIGKIYDSTGAELLYNLNNRAKRDEWSKVLKDSEPIVLFAGGVGIIDEKTKLLRIEPYTLEQKEGKYIAITGEGENRKEWEIGPAEIENLFNLENVEEKDNEFFYNGKVVDIKNIEKGYIQIEGASISQTPQKLFTESDLAESFARAATNEKGEDFTLASHTIANDIVGGIALNRLKFTTGTKSLSEEFENGVRTIKTGDGDIISYIPGSGEVIVKKSGDGGLLRYNLIDNQQTQITDSSYVAEMNKMVELAKEAQAYITPEGTFSQNPGGWTFTNSEGKKILENVPGITTIEQAQSALKIYQSLDPKAVKDAKDFYYNTEQNYLSFEDSQKKIIRANFHQIGGENIVVISQVTQDELKPINIYINGQKTDIGESEVYSIGIDADGNQRSQRIEYLGSEDVARIALTRKILGIKENEKITMEYTEDDNGEIIDERAIFGKENKPGYSVLIFTEDRGYLLYHQDEKNRLNYINKDGNSLVEERGMSLIDQDKINAGESLWDAKTTVYIILYKEGLATVGIKDIRGLLRGDFKTPMFNYDPEKQEWTTLGREKVEETVVLAALKEIEGLDEKKSKEILEEIKNHISSDLKANKEKNKEKIQAARAATPAARAIDNRLNKFYQERAAYELTWRLLNDVLGKFAYDKIDDMCLEKKK